MKILFIGDVMGKPGRKAVDALLPEIKKEYEPDFVIANAENLAHGKGITKQTLDELLSSGIDFCTSGNHIWAKPEGHDILAQKNSPVIRPANFPPNVPGVGIKVIPVGARNVLVINLMGRVFMKEHLDCPFRTLDAILEQYKKEKPAAIIVDFHAEATSEKNTFGLYADGRVSAVLGTHTHIPTADERVLPKGTAYITDVGMVGLKNSSIGIEYEGILKTFLDQMPGKFEIPDHGLVFFNAVLLDIDTKDCHARSIARIQRDIEI
ncbi:TIGR00282 family metallophosphoesterase [Candidatus Uhrbacteria bacterium]|nr:TIGR00282 family metallophosphoesterase [Candidatus Uhrbacteria bacterium]